MNKFKIGDIVECNCTVGDILRGPGLSGKILHIDGGREQILVEFDVYIKGHCGNGYCNYYDGKNGHCWWVFPEDLKLVKEEIKITKLYGIVKFCKENYV